MRIKALVLPLLLCAFLVPASVSQAQNSGASAEDIAWQEAGDLAMIGNVVQLSIPEQCQFTDNAGAKIFDELTQNVHNPRTLGLLLCSLGAPGGSEERYWFAHYEFDADGYVKNAASDRLDADAILESIRQGTEAANEERRSRGWATMEVLGWERRPYYNSVTNNATWALRGRSSDGDIAINHRVRVLGRRGVLSVNMISGPGDFAEAVAAFDDAMTGTSFLPGERYAEFREGDKVASYGLTALIAGGAGAAAAKLGLFSKLWKFVVAFLAAAWKFLAIAIIALFGRIKSLFSNRTRTTESEFRAPPSD